MWWASAIPLRQTEPLPAGSRRYFFLTTAETRSLIAWERGKKTLREKPFQPGKKFTLHGI